MTPTPEEIEALLAARRAERADPSPSADAAWRLAAGEALAPAERQAVLHDGEALRELAIAQVVLEARGRRHPDAERSAAAVLARMQATPRRRRWGYLTGLATLAAAAVLWLSIRPAPALVFGPVEQVRVAVRGTEELAFRVEVVPAQAAYLAVWLVVPGADSLVQRLHPGALAPSADPGPADWPTGRQPAGVAMRVPPAAAEPFRAPVRGGYLVLVAAAGPLEQPQLDTWQGQLAAAMATPAPVDVVAAATAILQGPARQVAVQPLVAK